MALDQSDSLATASVAAARWQRWPVPRIERLVALVVAGLTVPLFAVVYGPNPAIRYMIGLTLALIVQRVFIAVLRERAGPEPSSAANVLTLLRAAIGALLVGLVLSGIRDRLGLAGIVAFGAALLGATALDWLDGPLARRAGPTRLGAALDIEADSWLTLWCAASAVAWGDLPWIVLLPPLAHYPHTVLALRRGELPAGGGPWWARVTGVAQMALLLGALVPIEAPWRGTMLGTMAWPIAAAQLVAMLVTLAAAIRRSR
jgi:phosphatidylglycerophosphate synthase